MKLSTAFNLFQRFLDAVISILHSHFYSLNYVRIIQSAISFMKLSAIIVFH